MEQEEKGASQELKAKIFVPDLEIGEQAKERLLIHSTDLLIPVHSFPVLDPVVP